MHLSTVELLELCDEPATGRAGSAEHLASCTACARELAALLSTRERLRLGAAVASTGVDYDGWPALREKLLVPRRRTLPRRAVAAIGVVTLAAAALLGIVASRSGIVASPVVEALAPASEQAPALAAAQDAAVIARSVVLGTRIANLEAQPGVRLLGDEQRAITLRADIALIDRELERVSEHPDTRRVLWESRVRLQETLIALLGERAPVLVL